MALMTKIVFLLNGRVIQKRRTLGNPVHIFLMACSTNIWGEERKEEESDSDSSSVDLENLSRRRRQERGPEENLESTLPRSSIRLLHKDANLLTHLGF